MANELTVVRGALERWHAKKMKALEELNEVPTGTASMELDREDVRDLDLIIACALDTVEVAEGRR